jgi:hypothetical protein
MNTKQRLHASSAAFWIISLTSLSACNVGDVLGKGGDSGNNTFAPDYSMTAPAHRAELPCADQNSNHLCIALKYASFQDSSGAPIVTNPQAKQNITAVNTLWSQCHIQFYVESYTQIDPKSYGLAYSSSTSDDLQSVRGALSDGNTLLVAITGQWSGNLGSQSANAWTSLPPVGPFGSVFEQSVAKYPNLIAHELGHSLNLSHESDSFNVMNPVVYSNSLNLTDTQCSEARATAISFWGSVLR